MATELIDYLADPKSRERATARRWRLRNLDKMCVVSRNWRKRHPDKALDMDLRRFNITSEQYKQLLDDQRGVCAICERTNSTGKRLSVDHDHRCCVEKGKSCGKCVRGLLCVTCNQAIGMLQDSPALLFAAMNYIMKYSE